LRFRLTTQYDASMKSLGKGLQVVGLVLLPLACMLEMQFGSLGRGSVANMLLMMIGGVIAFVLGRYVEGYAR
jgi:hypothetical protein